MSITTHLNRRTAASVLLALGMVVLVLAMQLAKPSKVQNQFAPSFKRVAAIGEPVELRAGTVTLTKVRLAKSLQAGDEKLMTTGYWLLVDYRFFQLRESESLTPDLYTADNTKYTTSLRPGASSAKTSIYASPGFKSGGVLVYEIPKQALPGARIAIGNGGLFGVPLWDDQAVVPLGLDQAGADRLVRNAPPVIVLSE